MSIVEYNLNIVKCIMSSWVYFEYNFDNVEDILIYLSINIEKFYWFEILELVVGILIIF